MPAFIYLLRCPITEEVRYVGKAVDPKRRFRAHICAARAGEDHHNARWIRTLLRRGLMPVLDASFVVPNGEDWRDHERRLIAELRDQGCRLTNLTSGGDGTPELSPESIARRRASRRATMKESGAQERLNRAIREAHARPEVRAKMVAAGTEVGSRPEVKALKAEFSRGMWQDEVTRGRILQGLLQPQTKAKQSARRKEYWADPERSAKLREIHQSAETRAKKAKAARNRATPEYRAMMAERTRLSWAKRRARKSEAEAA